MQKWEEFNELIHSDSKRFVLLTHQNPDADAIGSSLGWKMYLQKKGHQAVVIIPNECPSNLRWMPDYAEVITFDETNDTKAQSKALLAEADVVCCLDFNALHRIKELGALTQASPAQKVLIDHHLEPEDFADFVFSDTSKAATAQYVVDIIKALGDAHLIDQPMAECLYAGIMTDTGSFAHNNTTEAVHLAVAELMRTGLNINKVHRSIFDNNSLGRTRLLGYVLSEKMKVLPEYRTVYMTLSQAELRRFNSEIGDTDGIVNYGLSIENIVMAVLAIERRDEIKLSFRSVGDFSVRDLAHAHFDGGGHRNASGGRTNTTLEKTVEKLMAALPNYQAELLEVKK
ncbi:MAG: bifunctional oligoribonuclease/PAP phosphatase NrnA [Spirosomaceae bacterium]|jgi:phosphoesterase RecJ-like protein|nr:bifunctional oligoribonuclease/PAP phosphatase NrnA [Spirosomataceae bacterium]